MPVKRDIEAGRAYVLIEAVDKTGKILTNISRRLDRFGQRITSMGMQLTALGVALGMPLANAVKEAANFDDLMMEIQGILSLTADEADRLRRFVEHMGSTTVFEPEEIAKASRALARAGFSFQEIFHSLQDTLALARTSGMGMEEASKIMARAIRTFSLEASESTKVVDALFTASKHGTATMQELAQALSFSGGTASELGLSLGQTVSMLTKMANKMLFGTKGGTSLNQMLINLGRRAEDLEGTLGVNIFDERTGEMRDPLAVIVEISKAIRRLPDKKRLDFVQDVFNVRGARASFAIMRAIEEITETINEVENSSGSAAKQVDLMNQSLHGVLKLISSAFKNLRVQVGMALKPLFEGIRDNLIPVINGFSMWAKANEELIQEGAKAILIITATGVALIALGLSIKIVALSLSGLLVLLGGLKAIFALFSVLVNPITLVALAAGSFLVLFREMYKAGQSIRRVLTGTTEDLWDMEDALDKTTKVGADAMKELRDLTNLIPKAFFDTFSELVRISDETFKAVSNRIMAGDIEGALEVMVTGLKLQWVLLSSFMEETWATLSLNIQEVMLGAFTAIIEGMKNTEKWFHTLAGGLLIGIGRIEEGEKHLRRNIELDTMFSIFEGKMGAELTELRAEYDKLIKGLEGKREEARGRFKAAVEAPLGGPTEPEKPPLEESEDKLTEALDRLRLEGITNKLPKTLEKGTVEAAKAAFENRQAMETVRRLGSIERHTERAASALERIDEAMAASEAIGIMGVA